MNESDIGEQWSRLCDEHEAARDTYFRAFSAVNQKFVAIGNNTSRVNPTEGELSDFQKTWQVWQEVKRRMDEFVKSYVESRGQRFLRDLRNWGDSWLSHRSPMPGAPTFSAIWEIALPLFPDEESKPPTGQQRLCDHTAESGPPRARLGGRCSAH